jgi:hypothetical protein
MGAAVGSEKSAQKNEDDVLFPFEIRQAHSLAVNIVQFKIGGKRKDFYGCLLAY